MRHKCLRFYEAAIYISSLSALSHTFHLNLILFFQKTFVLLIYFSIHWTLNLQSTLPGFNCDRTANNNWGCYQPRWLAHPDCWAQILVSKEQYPVAIVTLSAAWREVVKSGTLLLYSYNSVLETPHKWNCGCLIQKMWKGLMWHVKQITPELS